MSKSRKKDKKIMAKTRFNWIDPFLLNEQLTDEERMIRDAARDQ
jgi:glutaryl-CoA dehydrogenase